jgi:ribonucleoside-diphosphate reductase alpha chain
MRTETHIIPDEEPSIDEFLQEYELLSDERKKLQAAGSIPGWYITPGWQMFKKKYAVPGEDWVRGRHAKIAKTLARHMGKHAAKFEKLFFREMWDGVLSPASPALANTGTDRGMMVSCSGQYVGDNVDSFYANLRETALLSKQAFGTSAVFSDIRPRGTVFNGTGVANGPVDVINDFFTTAAKISQGGNRRGSVGAYLHIDHPDWDEAADQLLADNNGKNYGWIITDKFIELLKDNDKEANRRWSKALFIKLVTGKGYIFKVDEANRHRPQMYKDLGLDIKASNLCTEIMLHSSDDFTFSCILASLNLVHWDRIKSSDSVFIATVFLDCLCQEFIEKSKGVPGMEKVREFTMKGRAIGLGVMGFHTFLQSKMLPYIGLEAQFLSREIAKHIHDESLRASQWLAQEFGEPEWCKGYGVRNTHRTAYAPTKTSSLLMGGVSESWFADPGMVYEAGSSVGELRRIPQEFHKMMKAKGVYSKETVSDIIRNLGSAQHVDWLTPEEKLVFLNAYEMDQEIPFRHHEQRQPYTCQGQSLNFYIGGTDDDIEEKFARLMTRVLLSSNCISQYYAYSMSGVVVQDECVSCAA